ncbi:hypothetical protein ACG9XW_08240 [Acinetobacter guillouiae]|uniref:hypothetical protein n=1 Tax=Acinetobacter guillouiae TaxID=106649 RepID=UPI003AF58D24
MKKDPIELAVYIATGLFLAYLIYICFIAEPDQFLFGNVFIKKNSIDFGGFGGLLSGVFAPLAFLWLILNFRQQDKNLKIAEAQLNILLQEITNKRKVSKAVFTVDTENSKYYITGESALNFEIPLICDRALVNLYSNGFSDSTPFSLIPCFSRTQTYLSNSKKTIKAEQKIYLSILFHFGNYGSTNLIERVFQIHYLDIDGFDQVQNFKASLYIPGENALLSYVEENIKGRRAILLIQPQSE